MGKNRVENVNALTLNHSLDFVEETRKRNKSKQNG